MIEQFILKSRKYILDEIKDGENIDEGKSTRAGESCSLPTALIFDKGKVPHPADTKATVHLRGTIFLSLNQGQYPKIPAYDTSKFDIILKNWAIEHYVLDHEVSSELEKLSLYPSLYLFYIAPNLKPWNKKSETFFKALFHHCSVDLFLANAVTSGIPLLTKEHFTDLTKFVTNIFTGMYRFPDVIPNFDIPFLNTTLKGWFTVYVELNENVAGYEKYHGHFLKEIIDWIQVYKCAALYMGSNWEPNGDLYQILRKMSGRKVLLELIQIITATYVDDYIRNHVLFQMFVESADLIHNSVYDIFNFTRASLNKKYVRNSLVINARNKGIPFKDALERHLNMVNNEVVNFRKMAQALASEFPGSEAVEKYVENTMLFVDGTIRYVASQKRYGECEYKIMRLRKSSSVVEK